MFGRRKQQSFSELKETMRATPDADGVTRVFPKELSLILRSAICCGSLALRRMMRATFCRQQSRNHVVSSPLSEERLHERVESFNREMTARHGYCRAAPFLVIDHTIWDGEHGAFL